MSSPSIPPIGERIRTRRHAQKISLDELATKTGLSKSFLSQIERSVSSPSIDSISLIAEALKVPMFLFFVEESVGKVVIHKDERRVIQVSDSRFHYESIWFGSDHKMEVLIGRLEVGEMSTDQPRHHSTSVFTRIEECCFVLEGAIEVQIGEEKYNLEVGDSAYYDGTMPHKFINTGDQVAVVLFAIVPPVLSR